MQTEEYLQLNAKMGRPIPGQSLTDDPNNPGAYERQPEFTSIHSASEYIFSTIIDEDNYVPLMQAVAGGEPLSELSQAMLFKGFHEGKWNPDLMLLLIEPVMYMFLALAEKLGIDPVIYTDEDEDEMEDERASGTMFEEKALEKIKDVKTTAAPPAGALSDTITEKLESLPEIPKESLLAASQEDEGTEEDEESLLAPSKQ